MSHITVQIGPCCTVPFGDAIPDDLASDWDLPVSGHRLNGPGSLRRLVTGWRRSARRSAPRKPPFSNQAK